MPAVEQYPMSPTVLRFPPTETSALATLRNVGSSRVSLVDLATFFLAPALVSFFIARNGIQIDRDSYSTSISVFAIFAAFLFSVEVAIFGILQRDWRQDDDNNIDKLIKERLSFSQNAAC